MPISKNDEIPTRSTPSFWRNVATASIDVIKPQDNERATIKLGSMQDWSYLLPVIGCVMVGVKTIPNFSTGLLFGVMNWVASVTAAVPLASFREKQISSEEDPYQDFLQSNLLYCSLWGPIKEELIFRGVIQRLLAEATTCLLPNTANTQFSGCNFNIGVAIAILTTSIAFGVCHLRNGHSNSHYQAIGSFTSGILNGYIAAQHGLGAAMAGHIMKNTLTMTLLNLATINTKDALEPPTLNVAPRM